MSVRVRMICVHLFLLQVNIYLLDKDLCFYWGIDSGVSNSERDFPVSRKTSKKKSILSSGNNLQYVYIGHTFY